MPVTERLGQVRGQLGDARGSSGSMSPALKVPLAARQKLAAYAHAILDKSVPCDDPRLPAMRQGADLILQDDDPRAGYNYAAAGEKMQHAAAFYFLRPSLENAQKVDSILQEILPEDLNAEQSVGLPIRGTSLSCSLCIGVVQINREQCTYKQIALLFH